MDDPLANTYTIPPQTRIGHVHLKVADLDQSLKFYCDLLGFELVTTYGSDAAFISAGGYHHHIGLNTWHSKNRPPAVVNAPGLYHTAILYPTRKDLAVVYNRIREAGYPLTGAADHGVSEALYLNDPDQNGVELYRDRPQNEWPTTEDGRLTMVTLPLDLDDRHLRGGDKAAGKDPAQADEQHGHDDPENPGYDSALLHGALLLGWAHCSTVWGIRKRRVPFGLTRVGKGAGLDPDRFLQRSKHMTCG